MDEYIREARRCANRLRQHADLLERMAQGAEDGNQVFKDDLEREVNEALDFLNGSVKVG